MSGGDADDPPAKHPPFPGRRPADPGPDRLGSLSADAFLSRSFRQSGHARRSPGGPRHVLRSLHHSGLVEAVSGAGVLGEGPGGSAWFPHLDGHGVVAHVDVRGPTYKGSLTGGAKSLFRLPPKGPSLPRLVLAEAAIDALSVAAIESLRKDTLYIATGGGMGPGTIAALEALLASIALLPGALLCSAADANGPGDRFADRHRSLAEKFKIPFARLRPPIEGGDWNDVLRARSETRGARP